MSYKKSASKKELYFVLWSNTNNGPDWYEATSFDSYKEAKASAEEYLAENGEVDAVYYIAKATEKVYLKQEVEKL